MTRDELDELREGWDFEAKLATGQNGEGGLPQTIWETYSAMANTRGGKILLGVKERKKDGSLEVKGIQNIRKVEMDLWNLLENPEKVSTNLLSKSDVEIFQLDGRTLMLIHVPKAPLEKRPVYIKNSWQKGTYTRVHEGDRRATEEMARRMLADAIPARDSGVVDDATFKDLDTDSIHFYRGLLAASRPGHPFLQSAAHEFFAEKIGAVELVGNVWRPTWAGLLLFGKERAIRKRFPHWHLSYKDIPEDGSTRWNDRISPDGTWNANLLQFFRRTNERLREHVKVPFAVNETGQRVEENDVHVAFREALVNLLTHADYQAPIGVTVERRGPEVEFINPGLLLVGEEQLWKGGLSQCRNPALQHMFNIAGLGEHEGSGGPTIRRAWDAQHWRLPKLTQDFEHGVTHLFLPQESLLPEEAINAVDSRFGAHTMASQDTLGRVILATIETEDEVHHARVRALCPDVHSHDITMKLADLVRNGLLQSSGNTRATVYSFASPASQEEDETAKKVGAYLKRNGEIRRSDVMELFGIPGMAATRLLQRLVRGGLLEKRGEKRGAHYVLVTVEV